MTEPVRRERALVFDEVADVYDRVRPGYPPELFTDLKAITGLAEGCAVLEIGCGTGQATRPLAELGCQVTAVEPGAAMAAVAQQRLEGLGNVSIEHGTFENWDDRGRRFDLVLAASSWHWVDPAVGWRKAHDVLRPGRWLALLGNVVVRRPGEPEVYAETADLHERFSPSNPEWGDPPLEEDVRATGDAEGLFNNFGGLFTPAPARWYPALQWFDAAGFVDLLGTVSVYRVLAPDVREQLFAAIAERIRTRMGNRAPRRYLSVLRAVRRNDP